MSDPTASFPEPSNLGKRPRSPSAEGNLPLAKVPRTSSALQINYLSRLRSEIIPLTSTKESLPDLLRLVGEYDGVIQRHESLAGNLGACPLGPILLKRFERMFDGPPKILKANGKDATVTWLDVVEFAQNKPEQFNLEKTRNGIRVCQFYTKQCRVEISEEDFVLIYSGMPQKLIPPQPIPEDEDKELGVLDILDKKMADIIQMADQVSARARQLTHKMRNRRSAIIARRELEGDSRGRFRPSLGGPSSPPDLSITTSAILNSVEAPQSPQGGFTAVNVRQPAPAESSSVVAVTQPELTAQPELMPQAEGFPEVSSQNITFINGRSIKNASPSLRAELMKQFMTTAELERGSAKELEDIRRSSFTTPRQAAMQEAKSRYSTGDLTGTSSIREQPSAVAIPNTPASLMPSAKPTPSERDDGGPFKVEMVSRMELMHRGQRVVPPCDRCRRLHMDCLKNLTACMGCTKKHAKCSWKDVRPEELEEGAEGVEPNDRPAIPDNVDEVTIPVGLGESETAINIVHANELQEQSRKDNGLLDIPNEAKSPTPRFDVRPPPFPQQLRDASRDRSPQRGPISPPVSYSTQRSREIIEQTEFEEGDRLAALAAQVHRSMSRGVRPMEG